MDNCVLECPIYIMNNSSSNKIYKSDDFLDNDVFDDSALVANFENSDFNDNSDFHMLNISALCCDEEVSGFDKQTGETWIYPTNYPVRDYQFNIIKAAIEKNTLVSLPTGLGKTFIAAVIMYNFYRWYPLGKIVFTAPTRPLVTQQIEACYNIVAIPPADTVEMTGHIQANIRKTHWETKRVFFATPQIIYNDLKSGICNRDNIRCLVIDEAHKARGNYAYCQIISFLSDMKHTVYRVLALSATPGSKVDDVITVVKNLNIAHLEFRTESCKDVAQYCHSRKINTVIVELGSELTKLRQQYVEILDVYARRLKDLNILPTNIGNLSKGRIMMMYKQFQNQERGARHPNHNYIMKDFTFLITLYHGLELLVKHGSWVFLNFFDEHPEKTWIQTDSKLVAYLERLKEDLGINPLSLDRSILPDGTIPDMPQNLSFGHPKFTKLKEIMIKHFNNAKQRKQETKAIVFCEYRESVNLVHCLLLQCRPLIVPQMFVGQGASGKEGKVVVSQKQQLRVMRGFRSGACNTLVCTCVAEEGLDVGSVDLILCFDISNRSPIRLVQRCGRTGRDREGQVFILVTEGREHQTLIECMRQRDGLKESVLRSKEVEQNLFKNNPRMIPRDVFPDCQKMFIKVSKKENTENLKTGQKDLRSMLLEKNSSSKSGQNEWLTKDDFNAIYPTGYRDCNFFEKPKEYFAMSKEMVKTQKEDSLLKLSARLEHQRQLQESIHIGHSADTQILVNVLQHSHKKKDLPSSTESLALSNQGTLTPNVFLSPAKSKVVKRKQKKMKSPCKKDGDIRAIFSTATKSTKSYSKLINELGFHSEEKIPTKLINLFVDLSLENVRYKNAKKCWICLNVCDCKTIQILKCGKNDSSALLPIHREPFLPDISLIDDFDSDSLLKYSYNVSNTTVHKDKCKVNNKTVTEDAIRENFNKSIDRHPISDICQSKSITENGEPNQTKDNLKINFDIGDIEDIFADSSLEEATEKEITQEANKEINIRDSSNNNTLQTCNNKNNFKESMDYFHLKSIDDLFESSDSDNNLNENHKSLNFEASKNTSPDPKKNDDEAVNIETIAPNRRTSPSILSGRHTTRNETPISPILSSQSRKFRLSINKNRSSTPWSAKKQLQMGKPVDEKSPSNIIQHTQSYKHTSNMSCNSTLTITQTLEMINKSQNIRDIDEFTSADKEKNIKERDRSSSPILLTQRDRQKCLHPIDPGGQIISSKPKPTDIVIVRDSDSDSDFEDNTQLHKTNDLEDNKTTTNNTPSKRKLSPQTNETNSPYFNKKPEKPDNLNKKMTLQEKLLAALTRESFDKDSFNNNNTVNFMVQSPLSPVLMSGKENILLQSPKGDKEKKYIQNGLSMLQMYRRDSKLNPRNILNDATNISTPINRHKRKSTFSDSDDDFEISKSQKRCINGVNDRHFTSHKIRKKKKKTNEFFDLEAVLSEDSQSLSGDELSDESVGSIIDFICDDTEQQGDDIHAHYLKSVKSPVKGVFKIPQLPSKFNKMEVLSQLFVESDTYEMDSFCVDPNVGLTQVNEMSELELAEIILEERRKNKKMKHLPNTQSNGSPSVRRKAKRVKRQIESDSDESS